MSKKTFLILAVLVVIVNSFGLFYDIFVADSALYATISKSFYQSGDYLNIYVRGLDWLDKPHFPFWLSALSMEVFGANSFAYKLPSLLFLLVGMFYTYKLAKRLYNVNVAYAATLILGSSLHVVISNNDVRAEGVMLGLIVGATYHILKLCSRYSLRDLLLAAALSAAAIMTKGIFILIIPYSAIFGHLILKREFAKVLNYRWLILFSLTLLFTAPEIYALYIQFDSNPDAVAFGEKGVSGIKFFFWDSQFGRFFNTGPIKGKGDLLFFVHTVLWAFAPWAVLGLISLIKSGKNIITRAAQKEYLTFFGFIIMFLIFSISKFQLSHYLNIIFPFVSIGVATLLLNKSNVKSLNFLQRASLNLYALVAFVGILVAQIFFATSYSFLGIASLLLLVVMVYLFNFSKKESRPSQVIFGIIIALIFSLYVNVGFYPKLLEYQSAAQAATFANQEYPERHVITTNNDLLMDFYSKNEVKLAYSIEELNEQLSKDRDVLIFANDDFLNKMTENNLDYALIKSFDEFHITLMDIKFFNYKTRGETLRKRHLVELR